MVRFVSGIVVLCLGVLMTLNASANVWWYAMNSPTSIFKAIASVVLALLVAVGGYLLISFGRQAMQAKSQVESLALQSLRQHGSVDAVRIASAVGVSEAQVRRIIHQAMQAGAVPRDAAIQ